MCNLSSKFDRLYTINNSSIYLLNFNKTIGNSTRHDAQTWTQEQSADLVSKKDIFSSFPLKLMTFLLGLYINKLGRKCLLISSIFCDTFKWLFGY